MVSRFTTYLDSVYSEEWLFNNTFESFKLIICNFYKNHVTEINYLSIQNSSIGIYSDNPNDLYTTGTE